ncbi:MAG: prolyl oligopeptidase family serine peptidase [Dehalococcoidia bacterium]|nr:prolyl oligopeptidase family serine peptidase [Dehalococcoidia bacterium]
MDLAGKPPAHAIIRRSDTETVPASALSAPEPVSWKSFDGEQAHGLYYPPASEGFEGIGAPPLIVIIHGGPTSQVVAGWAAQAQYFATRGYAVLFPNYRGSTGYGRDYMLKLRESWGIYDVQDAKFGADALADRGMADPSRLVIMGGSAGGYTVLQSLVEVPGFYKVGICMLGVANMFTLPADTHKFEARYLDSMLGPLPEAAAVYRERSPIFHAGKIVDPIAVFQGEIDRVVPREQSDSIVSSLKARGVPHEYHLYPEKVTAGANGDNRRVLQVSRSLLEGPRPVRLAVVPTAVGSRREAAGQAEDGDQLFMPGCRWDGAAPTILEREVPCACHCSALRPSHSSVWWDVEAMTTVTRRRRPTLPPGRKPHRGHSPARRSDTAPMWTPETHGAVRRRRSASPAIPPAKRSCPSSLLGTRPRRRGASTSTRSSESWRTQLPTAKPKNSRRKPTMPSTSAPRRPWISSSEARPQSSNDWRVERAKLAGR